MGLARIIIGHHQFYVHANFQQAYFTVWAFYNDYRPEIFLYQFDASFFFFFFFLKKKKIVLTVAYKLRRCLMQVDNATKNNMRTIPPNTLKMKKKD